MYERRYDLLSSKFKEFFLPTLLMSMAMNTSTFIDSLIVSFTIGSINLSAIQVVTPIITFINLLYWMIGLGGSLIASISKADHDNETASKYFTISLALLLILGVLFTLILVVFFDSIVIALCPDVSIRTYVSRFLGAYMLGIPFMFVIMGIAYFIRADGKPNLSFFALLIANVVNLIMDFVYILGFGMDIQGAALATVTGYIIGTIFIMQYFFDKERTFKLVSLFKIKIKEIFTYIWDIVSNGFPSSSLQLFMTLKLLVLNLVISTVAGAQGLIAFSLCYSSLYIVYIFINGTAQSMSPIVSVYYQEKDYNGTRYVMKKAFKVILVSSLTLAILFIIFPILVLKLFSINPNSYGICSSAVKIFALSYVGTALTSLMMFYTQAIQKKLFSFIISITEGLIVPVISVVVLSKFFGINGVWISFLIAELVTLIIIFGICKYLSIKSDYKFKGFLMLPHENNGKIMEYTVNNSIKDIMNLSNEVITFCKNNDINKKQSMLMGVSIEEMITNIFKYNTSLKYVDVILKINEDSLVLSIKDQGKEFNPTIPLSDDEYNFDNISVLQKIADDIKYSRVIGLNSTVIIINY